MHSLTAAPCPIISEYGSKVKDRITCRSIGSGPPRPPPLRGIHRPTYVYLRNSFTKKEGETEDEEQHNFDHGHNNDHCEQGEEEDDQLGDLYLMREPGRKLGNLYN